MLRVAAYNELHHKRSTARNGSKNNGGGGGEISCRNTPADYVAACCGNGDCTFLLKARYFSSKEDSIDDDGMYTHTHARARTHTHTQRVWKRACCIATHFACGATHLACGATHFA